MQIAQASTPDEIALVRALFEEYAASLEIDLSFQGFEDELAHLPGVYAPPRGRLLLARNGDKVSGCAALRPLDETVCELKRMYIRPAFRGQGVGRGLGEAIVTAARTIGYSKIRLDTLEERPLHDISMNHWDSRIARPTTTRPWNTQFSWSSCCDRLHHDRKCVTYRRPSGQ